MKECEDRDCATCTVYDCQSHPHGDRPSSDTVDSMVGLLVCNAAADCESETCHHRLPHKRTWDCENTDLCFYVSPERETTCVEANAPAEGSGAPATDTLRRDVGCGGQR